MSENALNVGDLVRLYRVIRNDDGHLTMNAFDTPIIWINPDNSYVVDIDGKSRALSHEQASEMRRRFLNQEPA